MRPSCLAPMLALLTALAPALPARSADEPGSRAVAIQEISDQKHPKSLSVADGELGLFQAFPRGKLLEAGQPKPRPYAFKRVALKWTMTHTAKGYIIQVADRDVEQNGQYLSFDPQAPQKGVFLTKQPTAGSYWSLLFSRDAKDQASALRARINERDWYLDYDKDGVDYDRSAAGLGMVTYYTLQLSDHADGRFDIKDFSK